MQLVVGSFVAPYVAAYVKRREDESEFQEEEEKSYDDGTTSAGQDEVMQRTEQGIFEETTDS
jgi:hypothetical protein